MLRRLARSYGVLTEYKDVFKRRRRPSRDALLAVLRVLGAPVDDDRDLGDAVREREELRRRRSLEPVYVAWEGELPAGLGPQEGGFENASIVSEEGETLRFPLGERLPFGYHRLLAEIAGRHHESMVISAPKRCYATGEGQRWGVFLPLYAMRSERNWGAGDLADLGDLLAWVRGLGGDVVGTLPLLAAFLDEPFEPSPYAPASRLFWNEYYLDVNAVPELERSEEARVLVSSDAFRRNLDELRRERHVDFRHGMAAKRRVLELLIRALDGARREEFERFVSERPVLQDYARFRGAMERLGTPWPRWPSTQRDGHIREGDVDHDAFRYHLYVQWLCHQQLETLAGGTGLFLDMPLGVHLASYDLWRERDAFAEGVSGGAPPDTFFTAGQDWGFPPLHPERIREQEYRYPIACLRHLMCHASAVRIDHVMWMRRMFWVPEGMSPRQGVYVRYPEEELYAILSLESHRNRTVVVGEDLGTVPRAVRRTMARHGVHRIYVLQYELRPKPHTPVGTVPAESQASLNTHDMPTFTAMWEGLDTDDRLDLGLIDEAGAREDREEREKLRRALTSFLRKEGWLKEGAELTSHEVMRACQRYLAAGPARAMLVNLEDLWDERLPQNMPGTGEERPNWVRKAAKSVEEFRETPEVLGTLKEVDDLRRREGEADP